ncbi:MAG: hypothetical protein MJ174_05205 [Treponema sp.]|nr:hypothetical protein [Treponema sp.]
MDKKNLFSYSPVRYFENISGSNLKAGEMGLITAKKGLGKTSILVQFGLDNLLDDKYLVHVSFDQESSNVISWYSSILAEISKKRNVKLEEISEDIMKKRTILNFNQETFTLPKVVNTIKALKDSGINIYSIILDGLNLDNTKTEDIQCMKDFIAKENMTAWFSYTCEETELKNTLDKSKIELFTTVAHLVPDGKQIYMQLLKNGDGKVPLDTKTLLMCK